MPIKISNDPNYVFKNVLTISPLAVSLLKSQIPFFKGPVSLKETVLGDFYLGITPCTAVL